MRIMLLCVFHQHLVFSKCCSAFSWGLKLLLCPFLMLILCSLQ